MRSVVAVSAVSLAVCLVPPPTTTTGLLPPPPPVHGRQPGRRKKTAPDRPGRTYGATTEYSSVSGDVVRQGESEEAHAKLPWYFERSHRESTLFEAESRKRGDPTEAHSFCEVPGTSDVRCVVTSQHFLVWRRPPKSVLVLAKRDAPEEEELAVSLGKAVHETGAELWLAQPLYRSIAPALKARGAEPKLWRSPDDLWNKYDATPIERHERPDVVATLGGDGLLLYANALFQRKSPPPPIVAHAAGSMGFLAPFDADRHTFRDRFRLLLRGLDGSDAARVDPSDGGCLPAPWPVSLRMRLRCVVKSDDGLVLNTHECLNEVVVDRGVSRFLSAVECFCNDQHLTTVQADGVIVATPTGSTAYSLASGGPMLHPSSPSMVLTPISPHSLSFRPIVFPDSAKLAFRIDPDARGDAWITLDGRKKIRFRRGMTLEIVASPLPLPTLLSVGKSRLLESPLDCLGGHLVDCGPCAGNTADWFDALNGSFNFNTRPRQKPLASPPPDAS